jgi:hypothetical protein
MKNPNRQNEPCPFVIKLKKEIQIINPDNHAKDN